MAARQRDSYENRGSQFKAELPTPFFPFGLADASLAWTMFPITRPILIIVIIFLILYHKNLTDLEYAAKRAAKDAAATVVDTVADKMPLVVPGVQTKGGKSEWYDKLMGKKLGDQTNETVG